MNGILAGGAIIPVPGVTVIGPRDPDACLDGGDFRPRDAGAWMRQVILHKVLADDPETVLGGAGPAGRAAITARAWRDSPEHSAAQLVTDHDGTLWCLGDVVRCEAYHATVSNPWSVGIETEELPGGGVYDAALRTTLLATMALCEGLGIQFQIPSRAYNGHPIKRMIDGGPDMVGVFGHRDNTERRGRWDPGEELYRRARDAGAECFDFDGGEDLRTWKRRQQWLVERGHQLAVDGVPGPATVAALKREGYRGGVWALGKTA